MLISIEYASRPRLANWLRKIKCNPKQIESLTNMEAPKAICLS